MDFDKKVVWITGASSGIGEALAKELAIQNAILILSGRNQEKLEKVSEICQFAGAKTMVLPLDVTAIDSFDASIKEVINTFGRIDMLINNAGISQRSRVAETTSAVDRKILEVNFFGPTALTKKVLPYMLKQESGYVVAVSSIVGKFGFPLRSAYSASKHALHGFFESLRAEYQKENIKVSVVIPGRIKTNISVNAVSGDGKAHGEMDPGQAEGMTAEKCAKKIVKKLKREKKEILVGGKELLMVHFRRFLPALYYRLAGKVAAK